MASMQCYKDEAREFDYYGYENSSGTYQKPTTYSNSSYGQSYYEKDGCYEAKPGVMGYGSGGHSHQHGLTSGFSSNPLGHMLGHGKDHGHMGYGMDHNTHGKDHMGHNTHGMMGYGTSHNTHNPASQLGHVYGFGKTHEGHSGGYGMGTHSGCTTTYKKEHRRKKGMGGYRSDCSDSSDDERC